MERIANNFTTIRPGTKYMLLYLGIINVSGEIISNLASKELEKRGYNDSYGLKSSLIGHLTSWTLIGVPAYFALKNFCGVDVNQILTDSIHSTIESFKNASQ